MVIMRHVFDIAGGEIRTKQLHAVSEQLHTGH